MKIGITTKSPAQAQTESLVLPLFQGRRSKAYKIADTYTKGLLERIVKQEKFTGAYEKTLTVHTADTRYHKIILVGMGKPSELTLIKFIKLVRTCAKQVLDTNSKSALACFDEVTVKGIDKAWIFRCIALEFENSCYQYTTTISKKPKSKNLATLLLHTATSNRELTNSLTQAHAIHNGMSIARDLGNLPGNICTPAYLAQQARKLSRISQKIKVKVLEEKAMERLGMGAFLSVSRGSHLPGKLVCIEYKNAPARQAPIVLVGKGITFDTGGISIKPSGTMDEMKFDMCGAASVIGTLTACARMKLPLNVVGILACAENMPGGKASKPGDIVTTMSGQTVEILNTDAEGRLVLCDALSYAKRYKPKYVIDIATLTGACVVALGQVAAGLMGNNQALADQIIRAGENSGDRAWQLPMWDDYQSQLDSNFADIANIGGRWGGTITAACFLSRFTKDCDWAHLDIAGVAWHTGRMKGSTGRPVPLLVEFLLQNTNS